MQFQLDRDFVAAGEERTYLWEDGVSTVILLTGEGEGLVHRRGVPLAPGQFVTFAASTDCVLSVMRRSAVRSEILG